MNKTNKLTEKLMNEVLGKGPGGRVDKEILLPTVTCIYDPRTKRSKGQTDFDDTRRAY